MVFVSSKEEKKTIKGNKIFYQAHGKIEGERKELQEMVKKLQIKLHEFSSWEGEEGRPR